MKGFILKSFILISIMFLSVLSGVQIANSGIHNMKGTQASNITSLLYLKESKHLTTTVLKKDNLSHDLKAKKERLEKINAFNLFSSVGKTMSDSLSKASVKIINSIAK